GTAGADRGPPGLLPAVRSHPGRAGARQSPCSLFGFSGEDASPVATFPRPPGLPGPNTTGGPARPAAPGATKKPGRCSPPPGTGGAAPRLRRLSRRPACLSGRQAGSLSPRGSRSGAAGQLGLDGDGQVGLVHPAAGVGGAVPALQ